jgi:hypothetical protein
MPVSITFTDLSPEEAQALLATLAGSPVVSVSPVRPSAPKPTAPAAPAPSAVPAPPPTQAAPSGNPVVASVVKAMQSYVKAHNGDINAALKVIAQVGATKLQDVTDPAHLNWLLTAFSDPTYVPG